MVKPIIAIDLEYVLTNFLEALTTWHNKEHNTKLEVSSFTSAEFDKQLGKNYEDKILQFLEKEMETLHPPNDLLNKLKPLRKYFSFYVITERSRHVEKQTREWLDKHLNGLFDRLIFLDEEEHILQRKNEIFDEMNISISITAQPKAALETKDNIDHGFVIHCVPWEKSSLTKLHDTLKHFEDWEKIITDLENVAKEMNLEAAEKVSSGPKLARYMDDLVTISNRKPPVFYANIILSKFNIQRQSKVRLQASDTAITVAVQAAVLLQAQKNATLSKISTQYVHKRVKQGKRKQLNSYRIPRIEIILDKINKDAP